MKKIIFILVYIISCNFTSAQVQWAKQIHSNSSSFNEWGNIISDGNNNYMIGKFGSELYLPNDTLYASGMSEIFIAKFDGNGNNIWSKTLMDPSNTTEDGELDMLLLILSINVFICRVILSIKLLSRV
jgi:hypothetical protein